MRKKKLSKSEITSLFAFLIFFVVTTLLEMPFFMQAVIIIAFYAVYRFIKYFFAEAKERTDQKKTVKEAYKEQLGKFPDN